MSTKKITTDDLIDKLNGLMILAGWLEAEATSVLKDVCEHARDPRLAARKHLASASNKTLRADLIEMRGHRRAAHLRTRLSRDLAASAQR